MTPLNTAAERKRKTVLQTAAGLFFCFLLFRIWKCPFRLIFGIPCPGCGMSRALLALVHGDLKASLSFHPLLIPTALCLMLGVVFWKKNSRKAYRAVLYIWIAAMIILWLIRLVIFVETFTLSDLNGSLLGILVSYIPMPL